MIYDVIIIGSGPAGLTAAIYAARTNLKTLVIAGTKWGGQLQLTTLVENFPGFPQGIQGPELMRKMREQAERFGTEIVDKEFTHADFFLRPFKVSTTDSIYEGKSAIIATGADTKWLGIPGEQEKIGRGVSSCAPCDAFFFKEKQVIVVGGGDSAMEDALVLTKFTKKVTIIHRKDSLRASQIMQDRARKNPKISFMFNSEVIEILGEASVTGAKIKNNKTNKISEMPIDGVFVAIGHMPNSKMFRGIETDGQGFIKVYKHTQTNIEGVFVAGDVHDNYYKQAITAAGFGCSAALEAEKWLRNSEG
jgi:thioredoxin reductase (NADPH)